MRKVILYVAIALMLSAACKEKYELPGGSPATGYLVIDGVINSGQGPTTLRITRTLALVDSVAFRNEVGAFVRVEGEDNSSQQLVGNSTGFYNSPQLTLLSNVKYRLHINTDDGREYVSEYVPVLRTPPIDSLAWERNNDGVQIYVNTHDPQNNTRYYRWEYEETWEFHSTFYSLLQFKTNNQGSPIDVEPRDPLESQQMFQCWRGQNSTSLLIGSSAKLSQDTIHLPLHFIPADDWRISVMYSLFVRQFGVSRGGYEFLQRMKKNTEQVGSLFDAQPSELRGNVTRVGDPNEIVIGYVDIADAQTKRIFIRRNQVIPWNYRTGCIEEDIPNIPDSLAPFAGSVPTQVSLYSRNGDTLRVYITTADCGDCRTRGTSNKPSFWP